MDLDLDRMDLDYIDLDRLDQESMNYIGHLSQVYMDSLDHHFIKLPPEIHKVDQHMTKQMVRKW